MKVTIPVVTLNHDTFSATPWQSWAVGVSATGGKGAFPAQWWSTVAGSFSSSTSPLAMDPALAPSGDLESVARGGAADHPRCDVGVEEFPWPPPPGELLRGQDHC